MKSATATFGIQELDQAIDKASAFSAAMAAQASDAAKATGTLLEEAMKGGERVLSEFRGEKPLDKRIERAGQVAGSEAVRFGSSALAAAGALWSAWLGRVGGVAAA